MRKRPLTRIVQWGHDLLAEVVSTGDLAVDLTAGNGNDTLTLYQLVGSTGRVAAFDIQLPALVATKERLTDAGAVVRLHKNANEVLSNDTGVDLFQLNHAALADVVRDRPTGIIANLGYLPGGEQNIVTQPESTVMALEQSCQLLAIGGRMAIVVYPGHPGGSAEGNAVDRFMSRLDSLMFHTVLMRVSNRPQAPFLYVVEKLRGRG